MVNCSVQNHTGLLKWAASLPLCWGTQPLGISCPRAAQARSGGGSLSSSTIPAPGPSRCLIFSSLCPAAGASQRGLPCPPGPSSPCSHFGHLLPDRLTLTCCGAHPALAPATSAASTSGALSASSQWPLQPPPWAGKLHLDPELTSSFLPEKWEDSQLTAGRDREETKYLFLQLNNYHQLTG